jgi:hypothetical protein
MGSVSGVRRAWLGVGVLGALLIAGVAAAASDGAATVSEPASRLMNQFRAGPQLEPPVVCERVIAIGDSLMDNSEPWLRAELSAAGFTYFVDAQPSRQIPAAVREPFSGVKAARSIRSSWGEADCWMIALGSNDLIFGGGQSISAATVRIDEMLGAVTPGSAVWWVNVDYHHDPRTGHDMVAATQRFNEALDRKAAASTGFTVIDWYSLAEANLHWFFDPVHVDRAGSIARAEFTVAALPRRR